MQQVFFSQTLKLSEHLPYSPVLRVPKVKNPSTRPLCFASLQNSNIWEDDQNQALSSEDEILSEIENEADDQMLQVRILFFIGL